MEISFRNKKLGKDLYSSKLLSRKYGRDAGTVKSRLFTLRSAPSLAEVPHTPPDRLHMLDGDRAERFAVIISRSPLRLVFAPNHDPIPRKDDGGIDRKRVTAIVILEILNYH